MLTTTHYQLEVFKERLFALCKDMNVTLNVDGFDFEFDIWNEFDPDHTQQSVDQLRRRTSKHGRVI